MYYTLQHTIPDTMSPAHLTAASARLECVHDDEECKQSIGEDSLP